MKFIKSCIDGIYIIEPLVFEDKRGWFTETYSKQELEKEGIFIDFVQDNHSYSAKKGTLRGLHFQINPRAQAKLVSCTKGSIFDVAVDLRAGSPSYKKWFSVELSEDNRKQLLIPKGFAHGFLTLTDDVEVEYKVDEYYVVECERSLRFDDPEISIEWGLDKPLLSDKDLNAPFLKDNYHNFKYQEAGK